MTSPIETLPKEQCFGCAACAAACPTDCIEMTYGQDGFLYPQVDESRCVACGRCEGVCPALSPAAPFNTKGEYYTVQLNDRDALARSSSGGVFWGLANEVIGRSGIVVGCAMDNDMLPTHVMACSREEVMPMQGSKYVQSYVDPELYRNIKGALDSGKPVLFTGTPCQVAALTRYLGADRPNLWTVDLVCHGVASRGVWCHYVTEIEEKHRGKVVGVSFRSKKLDAHPRNQTLLFVINRLGEKSSEAFEVGGRALDDPFGSSFYHNRILRESCYTCPFSCERRVGDFTIGDYGVLDSGLPNSDGLSFCSINSVKGRQLWEETKQRFMFERLPASYSQINLEQPTLRPSGRDAMRAMRYDAEHPERDINLRLQITLADRIKQLLPEGFKAAIKRVLHKLREAG